MKNIVVIGGGTMGNGIAHTAAASGFDVTLVDVSESILQRAVSTITANLQRGVDKGKMTAEERDAIVGRIRPVTDMQQIGDADSTGNGRMGAFGNGSCSSSGAVAAR